MKTVSKKIQMVLFCLFWCGILLTRVSFAQNEQNLIRTDKETSIMRGASTFFNYCIGCHSLEYMRYNQFVPKQEGRITQESFGQNAVIDYLLASKSKPTESIKSSMTKADGQKWFGLAPSDLSLKGHSRGKKWLYQYLMGFYSDPERPWGTNNIMYRNVAMPNVLVTLQGVQTPIYRTVIVQINGKPQERQVIDHLELTKPGTLTPAEFKELVVDMVNFLDYVSDPIKEEREYLGLLVLMYLAVFTVLVYFLKRLYWKKIK